MAPGASVVQGGLAIVAGAGALPRLVEEAEIARGGAPLVVRFEGTRQDWTPRRAVDLPFEKPGRLFAALQDAGCTRICFAGGMRRPRLNPLKFDAEALRLAPKALALLRKGDDEMLRGFAAMLEARGLTLVAAQDLTGDALAGAEILSARAPSDAERADAERAAAIVAALGAVDVGQGAAVCAGLCLGVEAIGGTDVLLGQIAALSEAARAGASGGVLFKGPKPGQDRRMDLPAIGPETLRGAHRAGLTGICIAAGGALVLDRPAAVAEADRLGLALWSMEVPA